MFFSHFYSHTQAKLISRFVCIIGWIYLTAELYTWKLLAETYVQQPAVNCHEGVIFITTAIVAEVERGSTFRETCLAKEVQKRRKEFKRGNSTKS